MSEFHERLRQRKQEILNEKLPPMDFGPSEDELRQAEVQRKLLIMQAGLVKVMVGACLFMGFFSYFIFKDWYGFVGSPEYAQWKERVESDR